MNLPTVTVSETPHESPATRSTANDTSRSADARRAARPHEDVQAIVGSMGTPVTSKGGPTHTTVHSKGGIGRSFTDHQKEMLKNLDKHGDVRGEGGGTSVKVVEGSKPAEVKAETKPAAAPEPAKPAAVAAPETKADDKPAAPAPEAKVETKPEQPVEAKPDPELSDRVKRLSEHNRKLIEENERLKGPRDLDDRLKSLDAIETNFWNDPLANMRKLVALTIGAKEDAPEVDRMLSGVYADWTGHELKVPLDPGKRAEIGTDRNRVLIDRDKRNRERDEKGRFAAQDAEQQKQRTKAVVDGLGERLKAAKHGDKYPLLMEHSHMFDGVPPEQLLFTAITRGVAAGEHKADTADDILIDHYSKEIESYYKPRVDKLEEHFKVRLEPHFKTKYSTATSTATQAQASDSKTEQAADTTQAGVRTITNASASVAPPAPPAAGAAPPAKDDSSPPKFRNEDERRRYYARLRFGDD